MKISIGFQTKTILLFLLVSFQLNAQVSFIDFANLKQSIEGFGASTAWHGRISELGANTAFKNENSNQLGLSIIRVRIDPNSSGWADEKANAQKAKTRGALVLASPWTPPAAMKTNNNGVGGELKAESYADYAAHLKAFCDNLGTVNIVSIQNEPNIEVDYESCNWNATQLLNFCSVNAAAIGKPVLMPEAYNFDFALSDLALNDSTACSNISYVGGHLYGTTPRNYTNAINKGKPVWMTEHYYDNDDVLTCLNMGKEILDCLTNNMSAYVWWYLRQPNCNLINSTGAIKKKGYVLGQFSKFIRPGYFRVEATYQPQTRVYIAGFTGAQQVIVAVNRNTVAKSQTFTFQNDTVLGVIKYTTSGTKSISNDESILVQGNSFTTTLDAQSITTFVSYIPNSAFDSPIDGIELYPNPIHDILFVENAKPNQSISIYTSNGELKQVMQLNENKIDFTGFSTGVYFLKFTDGEKSIFRKVVKE